MNKTSVLWFLIKELKIKLAENFTKYFLLRVKFRKNSFVPNLFLRVKHVETLYPFNKLIFAKKKTEVVQVFGMVF